jgi:multidrug efflux system membrane fusion protein
MKSVLRTALIAALLAAIAGAAAWRVAGVRADSDDDDSGTPPIQAPSHVTEVNGHAVLSFNAEDQRLNRIVVHTLAAARGSAENTAAATVLDLQPLLDLQAKFAAAETAIAQARARATASEDESKRLSGLNGSGGNVSAKSVEAAQALAASDAAALALARQSLTTLGASARLRWSATVANWIEKGSPQFTALLAQQAYLLEITTPASTASGAPADATLQLPDGTHLTAHRIAALPQVDPQLQAPAFLYMARAHRGLAPGLRLSVAIAAGPMQRGVIVPESAVVWMQGSSWCYVESSPGKFVRTAVSTADPTAGGWFVTGAVAPGARVVTGGAQTLLSEEFRSQIQSEDDD